MELAWNNGNNGRKGLLSDEHDELHLQLDRLSYAVSNQLGLEALGSGFRFLNGFFLKHFLLEERVMEEFLYPDADFHKNIHNDIYIAVLDLNHKFERWGATQELVADLNLFLKSLSSHFLKEDTKLEAFLKTKQTVF